MFAKPRCERDKVEGQRQMFAVSMANVWASEKKTHTHVNWCFSHISLVWKLDIVHTSTLYIFFPHFCCQDCTNRPVPSGCPKNDMNLSEHLRGDKGLVGSTPEDCCEERARNLSFWRTSDNLLGCKTRGVYITLHKKWYPKYTGSLSCRIVFFVSFWSSNKKKSQRNNHWS